MESYTTTSSLIIEVPPYLTSWDMEDEIAKCLRLMTNNGNDYILDMHNVKNVYSATARLIIRLYERATRLGSRVLIINASEPVRNALRSLQIDSKMPVYSGSCNTGYASVIAA